ncbi:heparinase II/III family protein [Nonomuraea sp. NPDC050556]|uniref:heparinase II/III domain-containing protein n=1 Tax=Nonomuraea sp. NPDC050556 TaxID=3364369 RepID=UPI0037927124
MSWKEAWRRTGTRRKAICLADQFPTIDVAEVMRGRVSFVGLPYTDLGDPIDWSMDPHGNRSWMLNLHTLRWAGRLMQEKTGRTRAESIINDWITKNPRKGARSEWAWAEHAVALRAPVLVCLSAHTEDARIIDSIEEHGRVLADNTLYRPGHNHGLDQDIALLVVATRLGRVRWRRLAIRRMTASAQLAIDEQGVLHEQAPRYGLYVHRRLGVAIRAIEESGAKVPDALRSRRTALEGYIAHATQPDGLLVPIGDSPADTRPPAFAHGPETVKVFDGGYVFGRSAWNDPDASFYSVRFGPGRKLHGHEDHLGVTYFADGRPILVETGFHSYERTPYVAWTRMPEAHNVPVVAGATFRPGRATRMIAENTFADDAYGVSRTRRVTVGDAMTVEDSVPDGHKLYNVWHFAPTLNVVEQHEGVIVLEDRHGRVTFRQFADQSPTGGQTIKKGPISPGYLKTVEATIITSPEATRLTTVIS